MNIELLEEIEILLEEGKTVQEIANYVAITKSSLLLMLRMKHILKQKYDLEFQEFNNDFELLKSENIILLDEKKELLHEINLLKFEMQELKNPFIVTSLNIFDFSFYKEDYNILEDENYLLLEENRILKTSLNKIPMFIRKIFIEDER